MSTEYITNTFSHRKISSHSALIVTTINLVINFQINYNICMKKFKKRKALWLLPISITLFAFLNSAIPGQQSTQISSSVMKTLIQFLESLSISIPAAQLHFFIRKAAHFSEYTALGFTMFFADYFQEYKPLNKKIILLFLIITPIIDEGIQLFSFGRSAQVSDVMIDWAGIIFGSLIFYCLYQLYLKKKKSSVN